MLLSCFRKRLSVAVSQSGVFVDARNFTVEGRGDVGIDWERESWELSALLHFLLRCRIQVPTACSQAEADLGADSKWGDKGINTVTCSGKNAQNASRLVHAKYVRSLQTSGCRVERSRIEIGSNPSLYSWYVLSLRSCGVQCYAAKWAISAWNSFGNITEARETHEYSAMQFSF